MKNKINKTPLRFPENLLKPVSSFLSQQVKILEKRKRQVEKDDPFKDESRTNDNAALDTEADEQFGHARASALKEQIDRRIVQLRKALTRIKIGKYGICEICGNMIDTERLIAYPEATKCINCEKNK